MALIDNLESPTSWQRQKKRAPINGLIKVAQLILLGKPNGPLLIAHLLYLLRGLMCICLLSLHMGVMCTIFKKNLGYAQVDNFWRGF